MPNLRSKTWTTTTPATVGDAQYWEDHLISDEAAAKAASSVQTVNNITPDQDGNVDVVALPSGGTTGQVLTKISNTSGDADWLDPASGGHAIENDVGTLMTQQPTLQFVNADVSNDSVNSKTVVDCKGAKGDAATVTVGTTSTLPAGSSATVTNSGTTSAAVFNFGIPAGEDGTDGEDGVSVTGVELISTSGKVKTYRMTFSDGNHFDYQVTDGADGSGAGDMLKADYDSDSSVYNAGGIASYVGGVLPVITNTYSSTSEDGMSGKAVASAISGIVIPVITNTYSGTSEDGMSGKAVKQAIDALDVTTTGAATNKTITALTQTDGKIAATYSNISITKSQISDFPTIPTVNNATLTIQKNGTNVQTFTANQSTNATANIITDDWVKTASVSSGSVTFSGIDDTTSYGYDVYFAITDNSTNKAPYAKLTTMTGSGTSSMSLTYETDADNGTNNAKLRRIR